MLEKYKGAEKPKIPLWRIKNSPYDLSKVDKNLLNYFDNLPEDIQKELTITSVGGGEHSKTSRHYKNKAIDFRFTEKAWNAIAYSPERLASGITILDPNHGTAKHIHASTGGGSEDKLDVMYKQPTEENMFVAPSIVTSVIPSFIPPTYDPVFVENLKKENEKLTADFEEYKLTQEKTKEQEIAANILTEQQNKRNNQLNFLKEYNLENVVAQRGGTPQYNNSGQEQTTFADGGEVGDKKPIYVTDKNDSRLRAYQDSLMLSNLSASQRPFTNQFINNGENLTYTQLKNIEENTPQFNDKHVSARDRLQAQPIKVEEFNFTTKDGVKSDGVWSSWKAPVQPVIYQNPQIIAKQQKLKDAGYNISVDGIWGSKSEAAWNELNAPQVTNFEQRIQNPTLNIKNPDGSTSTHKMMSFEADGKYYAAPTIVQQNGKLVELTPDKAVDYALQNKEYKEFKTEKEAQEYANNGYKKGTPLEEKTVHSTLMNSKLEKSTPIPKTPIGKINIHGRDVPYYNEEHKQQLLKTLNSYKPTQIGSTTNYTVSRFQEKTKGWQGNTLLDENNNPLITIE